MTEGVRTNQDQEFCLFASINKNREFGETAHSFITFDIS